MIHLLSFIFGLSARARLTVAILMTVAVVLPGAASVVALVGGLTREISDIETQRMAAGKFAATYLLMQSVIDSNAHLSDTLKDVVLSGDSDAIASAALQSWLGSTAESNGLEVNSIATADPVSVNSIRLIGIQASLTGPYENVARLINVIENTTPRLFVTNLELYSPAVTSGEPTMSANFTVMGIPRTIGRVPD